MTINESQYTQLMALGPAALASALLRLAARDADAESLVARLLGTPERRIAQFYDDLNGLADYEPPSRHNQYDHNFQRLSAWLEDVTKEIHDPTTGLSLLAAFYRTDGALSQQFDDDHGVLFDGYARDAFVHYAQLCQDEAWLVALLADLLRDDDYGCRESLRESAADYLSASAMRQLTSALGHSGDS